MAIGIMIAIKKIFIGNPARPECLIYQVWDMEVMCLTKTLVVKSTRTHLPVDIAAIPFSIYPMLSALIIQYQ